MSRRTGSEVVDWLHTRVQGLEERRDARKLASQMLRAGYIRHTVNKYTFSEQCYYVFGDLCTGECNAKRTCQKILILISLSQASPHCA